MSTNSNPLILPILALALLVAACSTITNKPTPPTVTLSSLAIEKLGVIEQQYRLGLRIQNPNDYPLPINAVIFDVKLNDQPFAHGVSNQIVTIPRFGEGTMDVVVTSSLGNLFQQLSQLDASEPPSLRYSIEGRVLVSNWEIILPFTYSGSVGLRGR